MKRTWKWKRRERDLDKEIAHHLHMAEQERRERGAAAGEAQAGARREFGNVSLMKELARDVWGWRWLQDLSEDLCYGARTLRKSPGFAAAAILTLALGIGSNTAIFSVIDAVLLRPLPFHDPDRLVQLWETERAPGNYAFNGLDYLDWEAQARTFDAMTMYSFQRDYNASNKPQAETAVVVRTEANFFSVLGVEPRLGRNFAAGEDQPGKMQVAMVSSKFWRRDFAGNSDAVGKSIVLNGEKYLLVGVMPEGFDFPPKTDVWIPMDMSRQNLAPRSYHSYRAIGRLRPGITPAQALADTSAVAKRLEQEYPKDNDKVGAAVVPLKQEITGDSRPALLVLLGAVALVLLVTCSNVTNLLLARAAARQREMALRAALGAGRTRLVRQLLTESLLLSLAGSAVGVIGAAWCLAILRSVKTLPIPRSNPIELNIGVLLFTMLISVGAGVFFGVVPALDASRLDLSESLKLKAQAGPGGGTAPWRRRLRDGLVVAEIAGSLALLVGAALLLRSFQQMRTADIGARAKNVLTMALVVPPEMYATQSARRQFCDRLLERVKREPGVETASLSIEIPLQGGETNYVARPGETQILVEWNAVTPDYFRTFGIPLLAGTTFTRQDEDLGLQASQEAQELVKAIVSGKRATWPLPEINAVAVINQAAAQTLFPNQDAVGKTLKAGPLDLRVAGVVGNVKAESLREGNSPEVYVPLTSMLFYVSYSWKLAVNAQVPPTGIVQAVRGDIRDLDAGLAVSNVQTMPEVIGASMQGTSLQAILLGVFAVQALLLAAVGVYGVMANLVTHRTNEIGIRVALGAMRRDILRLVLGHGAKLAMLGIAAGVGGALALTRLMTSLLFGVSATDPLTFCGVAALLGGVALMACYIPTRRAMRVDPMVALRYE